MTESMTESMTEDGWLNRSGRTEQRTALRTEWIKPATRYLELPPATWEDV